MENNPVQQFKVVKECKFLGAVMDGGLRFNEHVNKIISKGIREPTPARLLSSGR